MTRIFFTVLVLLGLAPFLVAAPSPTSPLVPDHLKCAHLTDPEGIDDVHPPLSWILENTGEDLRNQSQSAYQIQVGTSDSLPSNLWDTAKVFSDQSVDVSYEGRPIPSNQECFWRVRIWDQDGKPSRWSRTAKWSMGILAPSEWKAKWIDAATQSRRWQDSVTEATFTIQREAATIYFRASGPGKAYMWQISLAGKEPTFRPHVRVNGFFELLKSVSLAKHYRKVDFLNPHNLRIVAAGKTIMTYLDGTLIDTLVDDKQDSGSIGFRGSTTEIATFRSIRVTDLNGKLLYANEFPEKTASGFSSGVLSPKGLTVSNTDSMLESGNPRTPMFRRTFTVSKPIKRAWLLGSALGLYTANVNGTRVNADVYAPGWTNYYRRVQYQRYNITNQLRRGQNAIGVQLAPGWYCGKIAWFGPNQYGSDCPKFIAELHIEFKDGTQKVIATDRSWKTINGPLLSADNLDGETYDARKELPGWDEANFDDAHWKSAHPSQLTYTPRLVAQLEPPIRANEIVRPQERTEPRPGVTIFKLPQDITGVARIRVHGRPGATVTLRYGEILNPDGTLNRITLESPGIPGARAEAIDRFTVGKSGEAVFQPEFTFHGFQYIEVTGEINPPNLADLAGVAYGTSLPQIGSLVTSNSYINQLQSCLKWSGRDAYMSVPMDCPQRSERLGWTGDANFYLPTAAFYFDMTAFYEKWECDMLIDGQFSNAAPGWYPQDASGTGGGWGDAGINVPYVLWQRYGDTAIIRRSYDGMKKWIEFLRSQSPRLITNGAVSAPADWKNAGEGTPQDLIATAYFAYDVKQMSEMSAAIGRAKESQAYTTLFEDIKRAFIAKFVQPNGLVGSGSQTSLVLALKIGLLQKGQAPLAEKRLADSIAYHHNHLTTGFVGTQWLLSVLADMGRDDLAYALLEQTTQPSWGYMMSRHTTTIWETWDVIAPDGSFPSGPYSLNHCALGSCGDWMIQSIGGICPDALHPGYKHFDVKPQPWGSGVDTSTARLTSVHGNIYCHWERHDNRFLIDVSVPVNTRATIWIPAESESQVHGAAVGPKFVRFTGMKGSKATFEVGSGNYHFTSSLPSAQLRD